MSIIMNEGRNKKLLVPVIALILCAAALIGAGYAASMSKAINTGNEVDGNVINLTLTGVDDKETSGSIAGDAIIEFNQVKVDGVERFYVEERTKVGSGTLTVDLEKFDGYFSISTSYGIANGKDFNGKLTLDIVFKDAITNTIQKVDDNYEYEFEIFAVFTSDDTGTGDYFSLPSDGKDYSWLSSTIETEDPENNVPLDLDYVKGGFEYAIIFTVGSAAEP